MAAGGAAGGVGLDRVAGGARPLSTTLRAKDGEQKIQLVIDKNGKSLFQRLTLDLSFRDDFVAEGKTVAGGAMGRGLWRIA